LSFQSLDEWQHRHVKPATSERVDVGTVHPPKLLTPAPFTLQKRDRPCGRRVGVVTGTAMGPLMPTVLDALRAATGATYELLVVTNTLFGPSVTSAGLLPGRAFRDALADRRDLDLALLPSEAVNDHGWFLDDTSWEDLVASTPMPLHLSYDFCDALAEGSAP